MRDLAKLLPQAAAIVRGVGRTIVAPAFAGHVRAERKADGSVVTATDRKAQAALAEALARLAPDIAFLGEEDAPEHLPSGLVWCADPLDGTGNFAAGFPFFAVSLALLEDGMPLLGIVYDPVRDEIFTAVRKGTACCNGLPLTARTPARMAEAIGFCDFKRLSEAHAKKMLAARKSLRSMRNLGSCALEWAWLAAGRAHFIVHGGQALWDFAAGSLLAQCAGAVASDLAGAPLWPARGLDKRGVLAAGAPALHAGLARLLG